MKQKVGIFTAIVLGMLTAFGPFVTDFYLPVMPEMADSFKTSPALVSLSLTTGMIGLAAGQLFIGPLTDKYGRRNILVASMILFTFASVMCVLTKDIYVFNAFRVVQGLGGAGGIVISRSMSTDMFSGKELARFMAILSAINGIAPVMAPVVGGVVSSFTSWRGVFVLLLAVGVVLMVCSCFLRETLDPALRVRSSLLSVYANLFRVFRNPFFTLSMFAQMFCFFTFFAYISSSPFILQDLYHLSSFHFSLCFGLNALMIGIGSGMTTLFHRQATALKCGAVDFIIGACLVAFCLLTHMSLLFLMFSYVFMMASFGLMQPVLTAVALDSERQNAGAASAIFGASGFLAGALSSPLVSMGDILVSSSAVIFLGALGSLLMALYLVKRMRIANLK